MTVLHSAPKFASNEGVIETLSAALGDMVVAAKEEHGEVPPGVNYSQTVVVNVRRG